MKLHRPRGVLSAGPEEPNALVTLGRGAELEPIVRATMFPVQEGLEVRAQNAWPSVNFDLGRMLDRTSGLWHAGFYNKTFKWPSWDFWERYIRRTAGIAKPPRERDPARYDAVNAHCDLLVVGGGPAGLLAAQAAARAGLTVIVAEQDFECGGRLLATNTLINDAPVIVWFASVLGELAPSRNVTLLTATTCFGLYDHGTAGLLQRLDVGSKPSAVRQRYWRVHAKQTLLATGAIEQPLVFEQNDLPGIMLAGAIRQYANRHGVAAGRRIVLATNNDSAYLAALDLVAAGAPVKLLVDSRSESPAGPHEMAARAGRRGARRHERREGGRQEASRAGEAQLAGRSRLRRARHVGGLDARHPLVVAGPRAPQVGRDFARLPPAGFTPAAACRRLGERRIDTGRRLRRRDERRAPGACARRQARRTARRAAHGAGSAALRGGRCPAAGRRPPGPPVARLPARRHACRRRDRAPGRLRAHRAAEALHDLRHGGRPGQDQQPQRTC